MDYNASVRIEETDVYRRWINSLKDRTARARVQVRVDRPVHGNPGRQRNLTGRVAELKMDFGPGYRVYYTRQGNQRLVLLAGGDKSTQNKDIELAIHLAKNL